MLFSADGNHSLHKKTKKDDATDVALTEGQAYFTPHSEMKPYLETKYKRKRSKKKKQDGVDGADEPPVRRFASIHLPHAHTQYARILPSTALRSHGLSAPASLPAWTSAVSLRSCAATCSSGLTQLSICKRVKCEFSNLR